MTVNERPTMGQHERPALDVWLKFDAPGDEEPSHEANTYREADGTFTVEWYHTAVGLVTPQSFATYPEARAWLEAAGYEDFSA